MKFVSKLTRNLVSFLFLACVITLLCLPLTSCNEKESDLGIELQDPSSLYHGYADTAYGVAYTVIDDSLITSGQSSCIIGSYMDNFFGSSEAILYSRVSTPNNESVSFDQYCHIDSVVLSLSVSKFYQSPSVSGQKSYKNLHFEVYKLEEGLQDTNYYSTDALPVGSTCFFDGVVRMAEADTMVVRMPLSDAFKALIANHTYTSAEEFYQAMKGVRIRLVNDGTPVMACLNLSAATTCITTYFYYYNSSEGADTSFRQYNFVIGHDVPHFMQFKNQYSGALSGFNNNGVDSLDGSQYLYLTPMGGTNIRVNFSSFVNQFHQDHPYAIIHYAELLLPVADITVGERPDLIAAFRYLADSTLVSVADLYDRFTSSGYDGTFSSDLKYYRLRITQHWQKLVSAGEDYGTILVLNGRRTSPLRAVINGSDIAATGGNPLRVHFVYSE